MYEALGKNKQTKTQVHWEGFLTLLNAELIQANLLLKEVKEEFHYLNTIKYDFKC